MSSNEIAETEGNMNNLFDEYANMMAEDSEIPIVDAPTTVEEAKESGKVFDNTIIIKDDLDNKVTIPGGFGIAKDSGTKVEEGIVIEDEIGNQFVWIPVRTYKTTEEEKVNNLARRAWDTSGPIELDGDEALGTYVVGEGYNSSTVAYDTIEAFKSSANNNGGYYIGRYEAGTEAERIASTALTVPLVQKSKIAYVYVTRNQAKTQSEAMYNGNEYVKSELASSYAWDTALNFICQNSEYGYTLAFTVNSSLGNINTGIKSLTGTYEADKYSNIYDFLGNCREWTTECYTIYTTPCIIRGGWYSNGNYSTSPRNGRPLDDSNIYSSFRIQLYIK